MYPSQPSPGQGTHTIDFLYSCLEVQGEAASVPLDGTAWLESFGEERGAYTHRQCYLTESLAPWLEQSHWSAGGTGCLGINSLESS